MPIYAGSHLVSFGNIPSAFTGYKRVLGDGTDSTGSAYVRFDTAEDLYTQDGSGFITSYSGSTATPNPTKSPEITYYNDTVTQNGGAAGTAGIETGSMNGLTTLKYDGGIGDNGLLWSTAGFGAESAIPLTTGSMFIVFQNTSGTGSLACRGAYNGDNNFTNDRYNIGYNNGAVEVLNNITFFGNKTLYNAYDTSLTASNMVSIIQQTAGDDSGNAGEGQIYYDGILCSNLTGSYATYNSGGTLVSSSVQSGDTYKGQGWFGTPLSTEGLINNGLWIGSQQDYQQGYVNPLVGEIAEIRVYNRALSANDIAIVHNELKNKWGF